jgi:hypothetical protein
VSFEEYLIGKKIDGAAFSSAEPALYVAWKKEFEQMHPNSFTVQKLNLINPIRRKYLLREVATEILPQTDEAPRALPAPSTPKPGKPVIKPKPKIN